jgi:hypothetical protein
MSPESVAIVFGPLVVAIIVFLIARELVCWYFKIDQTLTKMDKIISHLSAIDKALQPEQSTPPMPIVPIPTVTSPPKLEPGVKPKLRW